MILLAYPCISFGYLKQGFTWFLITHIVRQAGHFFYEHQDRDWEKQKSHTCLLLWTGFHVAS